MDIHAQETAQITTNVDDHKQTTALAEVGEVVNDTNSHIVEHEAADSQRNPSQTESKQKSREGDRSIGNETQTLLSSAEVLPERPGCCGPNILVYSSHFLSAWGDHMWSFAVGLFLVIIQPDSLQLTAIYGLCTCGSVLLLAPLVADLIDTYTTGRLGATQLSLVLQNILVVLCSALIYAFIVYRDKLLSIGDWTESVFYALIIVLASVAYLLAMANTFSVERDWVVEICQQQPDRLAAMTATMRGIDLTTQIVAPIVTGQIMTFAGNENGCIFIAAWNLCSVFAEYFLIRKVYNSVPGLRKMKEAPKNKHNRKQSVCTRLFSGVTIIIHGWKTYAAYPVMLSGLSLSMLYMTVLGFDNVTIGYAKLQGLSESVIGIMMGGVGAFGIIGTVVYPPLRRCFGLPKTGLFSLTLLNTCLAACVVSVWLPGSPFDLFGEVISTSTTTVNCTNQSSILPPMNGSTSLPLNITTDIPPDIWPCEKEDTSLISVIVLMTGIISARAGLWISDLTITQMFMETVVEQERGVVNGVQCSMNKLMDMIKFALVIGLPMPPQFGLLVLLSYAFIFGALLLYMVFLGKLPRGLFTKGNCCGGGGGYERI